MPQSSTESGIKAPRAAPSRLPASTIYLLALATANLDLFAVLARALKSVPKDAGLAELKAALPAWSAERPHPCVAALECVESSLAEEGLGALRQRAPLVARFSFCEEDHFRGE